MFEYNDNRTFISNFNLWFEMNRDERQQYGEPLMSREDALKLFSQMYKEKVDSSIPQ